MERRPSTGLSAKVSAVCNWSRFCLSWLSWQVGGGGGEQGSREGRGQGEGWRGVRVIERVGKGLV